MTLQRGQRVMRRLTNPVNRQVRLALASCLGAQAPAQAVALMEGLRAQNPDDPALGGR
tara:strand:- start:777 stop:950 length:174 start_codon:yes stop_codon:yes gene_type:complete